MASLIIVVPTFIFLDDGILIPGVVSDSDFQARTGNLQVKYATRMDLGLISAKRAFQTQQLCYPFRLTTDRI
jgi:hypothetical protein